MKLKIKEILQERNMSVYKLSKLTGMGEVHLGRYVHNRVQKPNLETVYKIAKALNINIEELIQEEKK